MTAEANLTPASIAPRKLRVIGVPLDLGQSRRGVDMGPSAVRVAGLQARLEELGHMVEDAGNVAVGGPGGGTHVIGFWEKDLVAPGSRWPGRPRPGTLCDLGNSSALSAVKSSLQ
jgi:Arginase family